MQLHVKMPQNSRNNAFSSKQTTNKVLPNIFRCFEIRIRVWLMFWTANHSMKGKCDVFRGYKETSKVCFLYLECKVQEDRCVWCIYKFKCHKTVERRYLATSKQQTRYCWCFYTLNCLHKGNNGDFGPWKQTKKIQSTYLAFQSIRISSKWSQQWSKSQNQSTNDEFGG